jgi:molybdenum cofactor cytidylyltransferase
MGRLKQLVAWRTPEGEKPLVAAAYDAIRPICDELIVVLGHEAETVAAALDTRPFLRVNVDPVAPMFESIRAGLRKAQSLDPAAAVVLQPGDHPEVSRPTLEVLINYSLSLPSQAVMPEFGGRGGHPVVIPPGIIAVLVGANCPTGLGEYWAAHAELCHRVPVDDASVVRDVDTSDDLVR